MKKQLLLVPLLFVILLRCTGEVSSLWIIEWDIISSSQLSYNKMEHSFGVAMDARLSNFKNSISDSGKLYDQISIHGYNSVQVENVQPSFQFKLLSDTLILIDTVFTWREMAFEGNVSKKTLTVP